MQTEELLKSLTDLFIAFEQDLDKIGCSLIIESAPYVYTWNNDSQSFDKDEFPEIF